MRFPVADDIRGAAEILGLDPLYLANEGRCLIVCAADAAETALACLHAHRWVGRRTHRHHQCCASRRPRCAGYGFWWATYRGHAFRRAGAADLLSMTTSHRHDLALGEPDGFLHPLPRWFSMLSWIVAAVGFAWLIRWGVPQQTQFQLFMYALTALVFILGVMFPCWCGAVGRYCAGITNGIRTVFRSVATATKRSAYLVGVDVAAVAFVLGVWLRTLVRVKRGKQTRCDRLLLFLFCRGESVLRMAFTIWPGQSAVCVQIVMRRACWHLKRSSASYGRQ